MRKPALIDAKTGELTAMQDKPWYFKTIFISQPFHFGDYGGKPMKIMWLLFDLLATVVLVTGLYLWIARRKARAVHLKRLIANLESLTKMTVEDDAR